MLASLPEMASRSPLILADTEALSKKRRNRPTKTTRLKIRDQLVQETETAPTDRDASFRALAASSDRETMNHSGSTLCFRIFSSSGRFSRRCFQLS